MEMAKVMSGEKITTPSAEGIADAARAATDGKTARGLPPIHLWNPPFCGDIDMRIARDGTWFYEGSPIKRAGLVKLFASIMRREDGKYVLVTPVDKVGITVDDAPFVAIDFDVTGEGTAQHLTFETNIGDTATAGPDNPIRITRDPDTNEPAPYVLIRGALEALIDRKSFYRLVEIGVHHDGWFGFWSGGKFFAVIASAEMTEDAE